MKIISKIKRIIGNKKIEFKNKKLIKQFNFLNNQNYILGKKEKKKLLIKYFIENDFKRLAINNEIILNKINKILLEEKNLKILGIFIIIILLGLFFIVGELNQIFIGIQILSILFFLALSQVKDFKIGLYTFKILLFFPFLIYSITLFFKNGFSALDDYFGTLFLGILYYILFIVFIGLILIILYVIFIKEEFLKNIFKFLIYIFLFFKLGYLYLNIFIFRGIKGYYFYKFEINSKLLKKFKKLEKNYAENEYYKIKLKN